MVKTKSQAATAADQVWLAHLVRTAFLVSIVGQIAIAAVGLAFLVSLLALIALLSRAEPQYQAVVFPWIAAGAYSAHVGFLIDGLSYTMMLAVTGAGLLIHIYSAGYMHDEADYARYFTYLNLFVGAMLILIMADNYLLVFVDWEGVASRGRVAAPCGAPESMGWGWTRPTRRGRRGPLVGHPVDRCLARTGGSHVMGERSTSRRGLLKAHHAAVTRRAAPAG